MVAFVQYMKNSIKVAERVPFVVSFKSRTTKSPLDCSTVNRNLGSTFYPRLISIYNNLIEGFVLNNDSYYKKVAIPELAAELTRRRDALKTQGLKMKVNEPSKKLAALKNYLLPQTVFRNDNFYISVVCRVYFGGEFDSTRPYRWAKQEKVIRFGRRRYLVWNTGKSLGWNIDNIFNRQVFQFVVRAQSNLYINVYDTQNANIYKPEKVQVSFDEDEMQDLVSTEMVLRSSSDRFDWILVDINGMLSSK